MELVRKQGDLIADLTRKLQNMNLPQGPRPQQSPEGSAPVAKKPTARKPGRQLGYARPEFECWRRYSPPL